MAARPVAAVAARPVAGPQVRMEPSAVAKLWARVLPKQPATPPQ